MPELVEMRERKSKGQGRSSRQGHLRSADSVLKALKKSRDLEERQKLVDQSGEISDATPSQSVQSLGATHKQKDTTDFENMDDIRNYAAANRILQQDVTDLDASDTRVLIIVTDHSINATAPIVVDENPTWRHSRADSNTQSFRSLSSPNEVPSGAPNRSKQHRSQSSGRKSCLREKKKKTAQQQKKECRVSFDTLTNDTSVCGSRDTVEKKKNKKKFHKKRCIKKAGKKLWKGLRVSCRVLCSGLALYAKPFGAMDLNFIKAWEERQHDMDKKRRQYFSYSDSKYRTEKR